MKTPLELQDTMSAYVERNKDRLIEITRELIGRPSENIPPDGNETVCQNWIAEQLKACGWEPDLYELADVEGLQQHPLYHPGRNYQGRPNVAARRKGSGSGRSLLLSGHIDTVPRGTQDWTREAFGARIEGNRLYGRGSNDMKAGVATNLFVLEAIAALDLELTGDLLFESVIDEEFGGCNGTLAGRVRGYNASAAILSEPSALRICPAQRGGRTVHITFRSKSGGILQDGGFCSSAIPQLTRFLSCVESFASKRTTEVRAHEMYAGLTDPVPVLITKVFTAPWGFNEPITVPVTAHVEMYWQLMPGETQDEVDAEFTAWLKAMVEAAPSIFPAMPEVQWPIRWLPGSAISPSEPVVQQLAACAKTVLGTEPTVAGIEGPCDLFVFQQAFGIPATIWGARGGNIHAADEYVEIDSLVSAAKTLFLFVVEWCGAARV
jgi:acetylornithine deacetylase